MLLKEKDYLRQQQATMLVVIDPAVEAPAQLVSGIQADAELLLLDANQDSIAQITRALTRGNYRSLHLVSHGSPGCLHLGATDLNSETITQYQQQLLEWGIAEILIYGCNVAAEPEFLKQLHALTGANIAASTEKVGQGNWNLEWQIGEVTTDAAFVEKLRLEYQGSFVNFQPQVTFSVENRPQLVAIGDLDGDGFADDLAVVNDNSNSVSILLGDGSGGFSAQTTFSVGTGPVAVAIGDLDGDTFADDLAVANSDSDNVSILFGNGSGGFSAQTTFAAGTEPTSVAIGDLDRDTFADDLAVTNLVGGNVSVLLGNGSGGFSAQTTFSVGIFPASVAIGDLDGDGSADDLAVANTSSNNVSVLLGNGSGGFARTNFAAGTNPTSVAIGDLDGDGSADDLAVSNFTSNNVSVLLGDGSGGFSTQTTFAVGNGADSVAIGDLDSDGSANDLAVSNFTSNNVSVLIECFITGTNILTDQGEIAVEDLKIGDTVITATGQPENIKWIGKQTIEPYQVKNPLRGNPVLIKAGALGNNLPCRDLYVSPDHAMFVDGLLINAGALVNDISIVQTEPTESFTYYHVELENHCLLVAEGTAAESYLPQKENRREYDNFAEYEDLYPDGSNLMLWPMDYPRISSWNKVPRFVSKKLLKIAHELFGQEIKLRA